MELIIKAYEKKLEDRACVAGKYLGLYLETNDPDYLDVVREALKEARQYERVIEYAKKFV